MSLDEFPQESNMSKPLPNFVLAFVVTLLCLLAMPKLPTAHAQDGKLIGGLLRELLESQVRRRDEKRRQLVIPGQKIIVPREVPANIRTARGYCDSFASESQRLVQVLRKQAINVGGVRPSIDELLRLQARAELMSKRFASPLENRVVIEDIRELDRDWRTAQYHLQQIRGLPSACNKSIERLNTLNKQCCALFDVGPQINRHEIERLAGALSAEIHHLERDVEYEMRGNVRKVINRLRRAETAAKLLGEAVADGDRYDAVVAEFQDFATKWNDISHVLDETNNRHIDRSVEEVHGITRAIHEQLWLPVGIDYKHIEHIATATQQRVKLLNDSFSLSMLTALPDAPSVIRSAQALNQQLEGICTCVTDKEPEDQLVQHWVDLDSAWREFSHHTEPIDSAELRRLRTEIAANVDAMRHGLGVQLAFDRAAVVRYAAELEAIALQAQRRVAMWQQRPNARVDAGLIRASKQLIADCRQLHEGCAGTVSREQLTRDVNKLAKSWAKTRPQLMRCRTVDQRALQRISDEGTARLIRLQAVLQ